MKKLVLATRGSLLALRQADIVKELLEKEGVEVSILETTTKGDKDRIHALVRMGGNGIFIREIEEKLLTREADIAVHSGKDLPYELAEGLVIAGNPKAADPRDCLLIRSGHVLSEDSVIGTGSPRRISEYRALLGDAVFKDIRGNVTTRLRKLRSGEYDAIILAKAGLDRLSLDLSDLEIKCFEPTEFIPSPCQGIIAVECRRDDKETVSLLERISDKKTRKRFEAERMLFSSLKADCTTPIGIYSETEGDDIRLHAMLDGHKTSAAGEFKELPAICREVKKQLLKGWVILVGGGCGPGLITEKGIRAIREADTVVYDDLLDKGLLSYADKGAELIYVGKRSGRHSRSQEEINRLLTELALSGKRVVRLKGGDSFVFGRGGEEVLSLKEAGILYELIPGISSAIAVPEHMGIPVTHRGAARSFTVITGHTKDDTSENWEALAKLSGTLVFLMGLSSLEHIAGQLVRYGKPGSTPVSILSRGFSSDEKRIDGCLSDICMKAEKEKPKSPAIIVVGETASFHMEGSMERPALEFVTAFVTGSDRFTELFAEKMRELGGSAVVCPTIRISSMPENIPDDPEDYDWIVFTSRNGIDVFFDWLKKNRRDIRSLHGCRFACIGTGTGDELKAHGIYADFIPSSYTAEQLGKELPGVIKKGERVLILRAEEGSRDLDLGLSKAGIDFTVRPVYRTESLPPDLSEKEGRKLKASGCDYIIFASSSGVQSWFSGCAKEETKELLQGMIPVCIGKATSEELSKLGIKSFIEASEHTIMGIIRAMEKDAEKRRDENGFCRSLGEES